MNVLYIDHYGGSASLGMEFRPYYLASYWKDMGINTTILAADYSHLRKVNPEVKKDLDNHEIDGIDFLFLKTAHYNGNGLPRMKSMMDFLSKGIFYSKTISEKIKPDVVICSSTYPLDTYIGQRIKKLTGALLIHEIHDLWPLTPMELGGYSKNHPFIKVMQSGENSAYKHSDYVVSILPNTEPYIRSLGFNVPVVNIPNGLTEEDINNSGNDSLVNQNIKDLTQRLHKGGKFVVGYSGGISLSNSMDDFINAFTLLKGKKEIAAVIIGDGILREELTRIKDTDNLENVYFGGKINKNEVVPTLRLMDALYIGSKKSRLYNYGVSANKIFDYMLTGKPIINAFDTEHSPMNYLGNTLRAEAENPTSIAESIIKASELSAEEKNKIKESSIKYVKENHNYSKLSKEFADLFHNGKVKND